MSRQIDSKLLPSEIKGQNERRKKAANKSRVATKEPASRSENGLAVNLTRLVERWRKRASYAMKNAEKEKHKMGRRLIEHGAACYFNCAEELKSEMKHYGNA